MTTGFWIAAGVMTVLALMLLAVPLWREARRDGSKPPVAALAVLLFVPVAVGLYLHVSTWDAELASASAQVTEEFALIEQLARRLSSDPDDINGWQLLGRSYMQMGDYGRARIALEQAWNRTPAPDDALKLTYAEAMLYTDESTVHGLAGELIDEVVTSAPNNQRALWWGGLVAVERNQPDLAVQRWTALLATNPPPEIANLIREQLGLMGAAGPASGSAASGQTVAADSGVAVEVIVDVAPELPLNQIGPGARFYVAALAPEGGAPLAVEQHPVTAVPGRFVLSEADAMIPSRTIAGQSVVTVVARISLGGGANAQPGDFFGEVELSLPAAGPVQITIDGIVPAP